ncbi:oxidation resistance protein 1a isoform X1 [Lates japonicus]|uniref:Oxidation resistance protein 1a isoform X1 n=1 Tax=Lates japonicus TaxID=270547 RepID=A0AAD3QXT0_LATJO|nr:oxidation resistance protein 1a isoform X1 [Lates japonicus]
MGSKQHSVEKPQAHHYHQQQLARPEAQGPAAHSSRGPKAQPPWCHRHHLRLNQSTRGMPTGTDVSKSGHYATSKEEMWRHKETHRTLQRGTGSAEGGLYTRSPEFLCVLVEADEKHLFNASASMQQYAQQGKKPQYWFAAAGEVRPPLCILHAVEPRHVW